jgi:hypothetical protein
MELRLRSNKGDGSLPNSLSVPTPLSGKRSLTLDWVGFVCKYIADRLNEESCRRHIFLFFHHLMLEQNKYRTTPGSNSREHTNQKKSQLDFQYYECQRPSTSMEG